MEGPSLKILQEEIEHFVGLKVQACTGTAPKINCNQIRNQKLIALRTWGKHFLFCFDRFTIKIHFLMFGSYRIDEERPGKVPRLTLEFRNGTIHLYSCSVQILSEPRRRLRLAR